MRALFLILRAISVLAILAAGPAFAAARHLPPSEQLQDPLNLVVVGKATERVGPTRFRFAEEELLGGNPQGLPGEQPAPAAAAPASDPTRSWEIRMSAETAAGIRIGESYLLGFTGYLEGRFPLPKLRRDPEGYRLVQLPVLEEALFPNSPELKSLITSPPPTFDQRPRQVLKPLLALLRGERGSARRCAALELALHPRLYAALESEELQFVRRFIEDASNDTVERDYLLQGAWQLPAAGRLPTSGEDDWVAEAARKILRAAELEVDLRSSTPAFHHNALRTLRMRGDLRDPELVARLLRSASPGVAQSAVRTLEALSPEQAVREVEKALAVEGLPAQSRKYFESFLRRMRAMKKNTGT